MKKIKQAKSLSFPFARFTLFGCVFRLLSACHKNYICCVIFVALHPFISSGFLMFAQLKPFFALPFFIFETMFLLFVTVTMLSVYIHLCYYLSLTIIYLYDKRGGEREKKTLTHRGRRRRRRYFIRCHGNLCLMHELLQYDDFIHFVCTFSLIFSFLLLLLVVSLN